MTPNEIHLRICQIIMSEGIDDGVQYVTFTEDNAFDIPPGAYLLSPSGVWKAEVYCCSMRRHFLLGIVGQRSDEGMPVEAADFILEWEPKIIIKIRYCSFCGEKVGDESVRVVD